MATQQTITKITNLIHNIENRIPTLLNNTPKELSSKLLELKTILLRISEEITYFEQEESKYTLEKLGQLDTVTSAYMGANAGQQASHVETLSHIIADILGMYQSEKLPKKNNNENTLKTDGNHGYDLDGILDDLLVFKKTQQQEMESIKQQIKNEKTEKVRKELSGLVDDVNEAVIKANIALTTADNTLKKANETATTTEKTFGIKATHELENEYFDAFKKYSKLSQHWLIASGVFTLILLLAIACPIKWCIDTKDNNKNELINEQKSTTEQTITKDGATNIIKQKESVKTHENKNKLADTLHDISPYATKFSIIALLLGLGTFCVKISLSYRRLAEEYNHKTILAKNLLMGGKALEGFIGDKDKMVEAFAIPSLLQILEDPLTKSRKDKGGNEATLIEKITNKIFDSAEKKKD